MIKSDWQEVSGSGDVSKMICVSLVDFGRFYSTIDRLIRKQEQTF